ncbi:hypothetical protein HOD38_02750 [archaeon]|jgi:hypothetical protein|nr:hypothetical protein [archaeon]MBT4397160.1 hypothetical protein [archaeon]MBT4441534.1 hypothetical protein [archaeon]
MANYHLVDLRMYDTQDGELSLIAGDHTQDQHLYGLIGVSEAILPNCASGRPDRVNRKFDVLRAETDLEALADHLLLINGADVRGSSISFKAPTDMVFGDRQEFFAVEDYSGNIGDWYLAVAKARNPKL